MSAAYFLDFCLSDRIFCYFFGCLQRHLIKRDLIYSQRNKIQSVWAWSWKPSNRTTTPDKFFRIFTHLQQFERPCFTSLNLLRYFDHILCIYLSIEHKTQWLIKKQYKQPSIKSIQYFTINTKIYYETRDSIIYFTNY